MAFPEPIRVPTHSKLPGAPLGIQTTDPGELQVSVTGVLTGALVGLAEMVGWATAHWEQIKNCSTDYVLRG